MSVYRLSLPESRVPVSVRRSLVAQPKFAVKLVYNQAVSYRYAQATAPDPVVMRRIARHIDRDAAAVVDKIRQPG